MAFCDDGKLLGVSSKSSTGEDKEFILGIHYALNNLPVISLVRLDPRIMPSTNRVQGKLAVLYGHKPILDDSVVRFGFEGLYFIHSFSLPEPILRKVYGPNSASADIDSFRDIPVADIEALIGKRRGLFGLDCELEQELKACREGQTISLSLSLMK